MIGTTRIAPAPGLSGPSPERMKKLCHQTWMQAKPVAIGDDVDRYLRNRGINQSAYPKTLRFHYEDQLDLGAIKASAKVAQNLFTMACKPPREVPTTMA